MTTDELADQMIAAVRDYVARAVQPLEARVQTLESAPVAKDGDPGKSVTVEELRPLVEEFVKSIPAPKDGEPGKSVTLDEVRPHLDAELATWALAFERRGTDLMMRMIDRIEKPKDGRDGLNIEDFDVTLEGRNLTVSLRRGDVVQEKTIRIPFPQDCGVFKDGNVYAQGDGVTWGGSFWFAQKDIPQGKPGNSPDWRLAVKAGRDGKRE